MPNIFTELITMKLTLQCKHLDITSHTIPSLCDALSCGFIHILAQIGTWFGFEVFYLKGKPLPGVELFFCCVQDNPLFIKMHLCWWVQAPSEVVAICYLMFCHLMLKILRCSLRVCPRLYGRVFLSPVLLGFTVFLAWRPTGPFIPGNSSCEVFARAELFEGICHTS